MRTIIKKFLKLLPKTLVIKIFRILKYNYEIILTNPIYSKIPNYPYNVDYRIEMFQELRRQLMIYIDSYKKNNQNYNFLNVGCGDGLLDGQIFVDNSYTDMYPINREEFFNIFNYYTLEYFDLDLNSIISEHSKNQIYKSDIKGFASLDMKSLSKYPYGFQKGHLKINIADKNLRKIFSDKKDFFDVIYSMDVLEHVEDPFEAAKNINFLLKNKGKLIIMVPFSYPYHEDPEDYWRFTHRGIQKLFDESLTNAEYKPLHLGYDISLRRDNRKGDSVPIDSLGGWRENWHTYCVLQKDS
tara:strand:- start:16841 stop:17734 length:894 start_codon:yes stop_codon:yes gene_type:complete